MGLGGPTTSKVLGHLLTDPKRITTALHRGEALPGDDASRGRMPDPTACTPEDALLQDVTPSASARLSCCHTCFSMVPFAEETKSCPGLQTCLTN